MCDDVTCVNVATLSQSQVLSACDLETKSTFLTTLPSRVRIALNWSDNDTFCVFAKMIMVTQQGNERSHAQVHVSAPCDSPAASSLT